MAARKKGIKRKTDMPENIQKALANMDSFVKAFNWDAVSERRVHILKVFLRLAATQGYSAVTMRALAAELNLKAPSIYSHFPGGKEEIISYSLRWQARVFGLEVLNGTISAEDPDKFFDLLVRLHCRTNLLNRENYLWDMIVATDRIGKFLPIELRDEMYSYLEICIQVYIAAGEALGLRDCRLSARQAFAALDAVHSWADWDGSETSLERILDEATVLCRSIMAPRHSRRLAPPIRRK